MKERFKLKKRIRFKKYKKFDKLEISLNNKENSRNDMMNYFRQNKNLTTQRKTFHLSQKRSLNFYCGRPQFIEFDTDLTNSYKIYPKCDYVPNELLTNIKS